MENSSENRVPQCNEKDLVSIIIPVYNTEQYVEACITSVMNQTYKEIEIIVVDDGSTDCSYDICTRLAEKDDRIIIMQQENQGVVKARNTGIAHATGKYIGFVDSDDWLESDMYEKLVEEIKGYDLVTTGYIKNYSQNDEGTSYFDAIPEGEYVGNDDMEFIWSNMLYWKNSSNQGIKSSMWNKLFRTEIVSCFYDALDTSIHFGEDAVFVYTYLLYCNAIKIIHKAYYHYNMRNDSVVHTIDKNFLSNVNALYLYLENVFSKHSMKEELMTQLEKRIYIMVENGLNFKMGFTRSIKIMYGFPYMDELLAGKRIVLYGAGRVGKDYYLQIKKAFKNEFLLWVDKEHENFQNVNMPVEPVASISENPFDYIIIAVKDEKLAVEIKTELINSGIDEDKIWWKEPRMA